MLLKKRWIVPALVVGAALAYAQYRRGALGRALNNWRRYSAPSASLYDAGAAPMFDGFFTRVAEGLAELAPRARVLEVGSGPGRLATKLAGLAPEIQVTGIDISPEMVARANSLATRFGVTDRVEFQVGDVAVLPFSDESFDAVVSTFSLHHWRNPAMGLAEIYRVLRPGGTARIYDVADWITRFERTGAGMAVLVRESPFGERGTCALNLLARLGPIPLVYRAELRRDLLIAPSDGEK